MNVLPSGGQFNLPDKETQVLPQSSMLIYAMLYFLQVG